MSRTSVNKVFITVLIAFVIFSIIVMRNFFHKVSTISPEDAKRISELQEVIVNLQQQIAVAESKEQALRVEIESIEGKRQNEKNDHLQESFSDSLQELPDQIGVGNLLTCKHIDAIKVLKTIAQGHTKYVQEGVLGVQRMAIKSANTESKTVQECKDEGVHTKDGECYLLANYKVLKEIMVLRQLQHKNIVRLLGMCVRSENSSPIITERGVTLVVEMGEPVQLHKLVEKPWPSRVQICMQLAGLLEYLADSPMGSIALPDLRDEQFIMVGNSIKLSDVDDIHAAEPKCDANMKCLYKGKETRIQCQSNMKCAGMNAYSNLQRMTTEFFSPLLKEDCPKEKQTAVDDILVHVPSGTVDGEMLERQLEGLLK
ncbi:Extracellular tyrosine-protein kinase PKDCC [Holothuria leucospilota]|uniref:Extracellular tyrosine-protein kinase PKDCC n=1 Tax=Holothuria leucospilota TaxID=206669 RepID=A0A9Q1CFK2_HOLLE|nr:Extracellular tyrosine-protein kinase PKDCC [Holothuria leucospilota]